MPAEAAVGALRRVVGRRSGAPRRHAGIARVAPRATHTARRVADHRRRAPTDGGRGVTRSVGVERGHAAAGLAHRVTGAGRMTTSELEARAGETVVAGVDPAARSALAETRATHRLVRAPVTIKRRPADLARRGRRRHTALAERLPGAAATELLGHGVVRVLAAGAIAVARQAILTPLPVATTRRADVRARPTATLPAIFLLTTQLIRTARASGR